MPVASIAPRAPLAMIGGMESFGSRLAAARRARGLTQEKLAHLVGVALMSISRYERDAMGIDDDVLERIAGVLGVRPAALRYGAEAVDEVPSDDELDADVRYVAEKEGLSGDETRRLAAIRQSIGAPSRARLASYAADIIDGRPMSSASPEPERPTSGRKLRS